MNFDVIVIGGGPAGMMAAGTAAKAGGKVLLLERNERMGRKLLITGKGRCNVTNNCDIETFMNAQRRNPRFLYSAIHRFEPSTAMAFFEELGVPLKTERGNRVFPVSDSARDIVDAFTSFLRRQKVKTLQSRVKELLVEEGKLKGVQCEDGLCYHAPSVIIATGGMSYPLTGSTGDGYTMAKAVGHTVVKPVPSLIPILTKEKWCAEAMGLSLKNVTFTIKKDKKVIFSELGEMLFTHFGVSGPLVLSGSSHIVGAVSDYKLFIDLKPGLSENQLDARILRDFEEFKNREIRNALGKLLPRKLIPVVIDLSGIDPDLQVNTVSKEMRKNLISIIKALPLTPTGFRPIAEAIVTSGGIKTNEVDPKTMMSKLCHGLFFAGEVLDLDGYTGGFNLQIAYSTAVLAGEACYPLPEPTPPKVKKGKPPRNKTIE